MRDGDFFWYDVMTTDEGRAADFYSKVVGWGTQEVGGGAHDYTAFTIVGGRGVAGLMTIPPHAQGTPPCWMGYIWAEDVDAMAAKAEQSGGKVLRAPADIPGVIRFAVMADPHGAGFLIAKGLHPDAAPLAEGTIGTVGWRELYAGNGADAFAFYESLFGWTKADAIDMGAMGTYQLFATRGSNGQAVGGMMTKPPQVPHPNWGFYFNVPGIDAAAAAVKAGGGTLLNGPMQVPGGQWIVQALDPLGAYFGLVAPGR